MKIILAACFIVAVLFIMAACERTDPSEAVLVQNLPGTTTADSPSGEDTSGNANESSTDNPAQPTPGETSGMITTPGSGETTPPPSRDTSTEQMSDNPYFPDPLESGYTGRY